MSVNYHSPLSTGTSTTAAIETQLGNLDQAIVNTNATVTGNTSAITATQSEVTTARNGQTTLKARIDSVETAASNAVLSESATRAAADNEEEDARVRNDNEIRASYKVNIQRAKDELIAQFSVEQQILGQQTATTVLNGAPPTQLTIAAHAGDSTVNVVSPAYLTDGQSIVILNENLGDIHATHIDGPPVGGVITLETPIPATWVSLNAAPIGSLVSTSPPEIERSRQPTYAPAGYTGSLPERITIIEQKLVHARSFRRYAANEGAALNAAITVAPAGYTVVAEPGEYTVPFVDRVVLKNNIRLKMADGYVLRPQVLSTTTSASAASNQTYIEVTNPAGWIANTGFSAPLDNGTKHYARITSITSVNRFNIQPAIPSGRSIASGALVQVSWGTQSTAQAGLINALSVDGFEIEGGHLDGLRSSLPFGRMFGIDLRAVTNSRIEGVHIENIASNMADGNGNAWGLNGDGIYLAYEPGYVDISLAPRCENIRITDSLIENCDRSGIAVIRCEDAFIEKNTIRYIKPSDGSDGNLGVGVVFEDNTITKPNTGYVIGNYIIDCYAGVHTVGKPSDVEDTLAIEGSRSQDVLIERNTFRGQKSFDILIQGNRHSVSHNKIYLSNFHAIGVYSARSWQVMFNHIISTRHPDSRAGIYMGGSSEGQVMFNRIENTYSAAILYDQRFAPPAAEFPFVENISIMHNMTFNAGSRASTSPDPNGVITLQSPSDGSRPIRRVSIKDNMIVDQRISTVAAYYGIYVPNVPAAEKGSWDLGPNRVVGITNAAHYDVFAKNVTLIAKATLTFGVSSNGISTATSTVSVPGAEVGCLVDVAPPGAIPTNFGRPFGYVSLADTVVVQYPQMGGTAATPTGGVFTVAVTKVT